MIYAYILFAGFVIIFTSVIFLIVKRVEQVFQIVENRSEMISHVCKKIGEIDGRISALVANDIKNLFTSKINLQKQFGEFEARIDNDIKAININASTAIGVGQKAHERIEILEKKIEYLELALKARSNKPLKVSVRFAKLKKKTKDANVALYASDHKSTSIDDKLIKSIKSKMKELSL